MYPILILKAKCCNKVNSFTSLSLFATGMCILFAAGALSSCNTVGGFGQDVERTGEAIEDASN